MSNLEILERKLIDLEHWAIRAFSAKNPPDIAANCRKSGEALVKIIMFKALPEQDALNAERLKFNAQIDLVTRRSNPLIDEYVARAKLNSTLHLMRTFANPGAHDSELNAADAQIAKSALGSALSWLYPIFLDRAIPSCFLELDSANLIVPPSPDLARPESIRAREIVALCHPRKKIIKDIFSRKANKRVSYELVLVEVAKHVRLAFAFLRRSININNTLSDLAERHELEHASSLTICTPRVLHKGKPVDRLSGLREAVSSIFPPDWATTTECHYVDDFVWDNCLETVIADFKGEIQKEENFVDQELFLASDEDLPKLDDSLDYVRQLLSASEVQAPISVILGRAGVGKTTFCEQAVTLVNSHHRKIAVYISATDLRNAGSDVSVHSISDLYQLHLRSTATEFSGAVDSENLELNLACGNIVLIIDALDEIESILKDRFNLPSFIDSIVRLNETFRTCSVIITSRDYHKQRYASEPGVLVLHLCGFNERSVDTYFRKRLGPAVAQDAHRLLRSLPLGETKTNRQIPLYLSLIGDLAERPAGEETRFSAVGLSASANFVEGLPLDTLVYQILQREISKQSLGISCDDYFDLLAEVAKGLDGRMLLAEFDEFVELLLCTVEGSPAEHRHASFYISPFLEVRPGREVISLKYDFLRNWIIARRIAHIVVDHNSGAVPEDILAEMYDGSGMVLEELCRIIEKRTLDLSVFARHTISLLIRRLKSDDLGGSQTALIRRSISGLLNMIVRACGNRTRAEYSKIIEDAYNTRQIEYLSIFGDFVSLDFFQLDCLRRMV
jgi:hypothetical protein